MKITFRVLSIILSLALLAGCGPAATPAPTATTTPVPTATVTLTPTITPSATPTLTPTPALLEISLEIQKYLEGFDSYQITEVDGVKRIEVTEDGKNYSVYEERDGVYKKVYSSMDKLIGPNGTFDMVTAERVYKIGVENGEFNLEEYEDYQKTVGEIYKWMSPGQLGEAEVAATSGNSPDLTGARELYLSFIGDPPPKIIGYACQDRICVATLACSNGMVTISFINGEGVGYAQADWNLDSVEQVIANIASGKSASQILISSTLTSEEKINPDASFTISSEEMLKVYFELTRGFDYTLADLQEAVKSGSFTWDDTKVLRALRGLPQPVPVYEAMFSINK